MIKSLHISNYALIEDLTVELKPGLNIFTGSTGVGKTIIIGALGLVLGERASEEIIRTGSESAAIEAELAISGKNASSYLEANEFDNLIIRREVRRDGRSRTYLNDHQTTLNALKEIGDSQVDITSQHRQKGLTDSSTHIQIVDRYANLDADLKELAELFEKFNRFKIEFNELATKQNTWKAEKELLDFQIKEIESASLEEDEDTLLEREKLQLINAEKIKTACQISESSLFNDDGSAAERLKAAAMELRKIAKYSDRAESLGQKLDELSILLDEAGVSIRDLTDNFEFDQNRLEIIEDRLTLIKKLKRKYGQSIADILAYGDTAKSKASKFENLDSELGKLGDEVKTSQKLLSAKANNISIKRKSAAARLEKHVIKHLADVAMKGADFKVDFKAEENEGGPYLIDETKYAGDESGYDKIEFLICPNPGEQLKPLVSTASGGELSRLLLAIISALTDCFPKETLIFDEIDTGISGEVASQVGKKLQKLAQNRQVICITHLQQIASRGEAHFKVYKGKSQGRSITKIKALEGDQRVAEIARLLAGEKISDVSLDSASQLLKEGQS
jgi:DNA repair protein RecN (Recombination protein N)